MKAFGLIELWENASAAARTEDGPMKKGDRVSGPLLRSGDQDVS